ncbi:hypothetical protein [Thalassomonas actiniarum]|uniref:Uncharacterized protein n=1 Tax=Thalassomonas actiniarum TaxID=485447 RepID=A0AAE9YU43_9GAMM|nr:hypothetical protein [Thalassomonas actiniarum]WDE00335.1 hypothetical protein SG35_006750 [Thalassomonas actiniarum]
MKWCVDEAKLMLAMNNNTAINTAKQAFKQARIDHQHNNVLHAALLLYQLQRQLQGQANTTPAD